MAQFIPQGAISSSDIGFDRFDFIVGIAFSVQDLS
jgi:hypothetical protein